MILDNQQDIGVLKTHFELTVHSKETIRLLTGRVINNEAKAPKKYTINGLESYALRLNNIWHRIKNDDPYAEMVLIEIERRIERAKHKISTAIEKAEKTLAKAPNGISIGISSSVKPITINLDNVKYYTVHTKLAAVLLADVDLLIRTLKSCIALGQLTKTQYKKDVKKIETVIRGVLISPSIYINMHINREDIKKQTEKGKVAIEKLGLVPLDILNNQQHSSFGPISIK